MDKTGYGFMGKKIMAKKMAVKTKQTKMKNKRQWSIGKILAPILKLALIASGVVGVGFLVIQVPLIWRDLWPIEKVAMQADYQHIDESQITRMLAKDNVGGMISVDLEKLQQDIMANPWIKSVTIRKKWPDTLVFGFDEYRALARINDHYLIENNRLVKIQLVKKTRESEAEILTITNQSREKMSVIQLRKLVDRFAELSKQLAAHDFSVKRFLVEKNGGWSVQMANQLIIRMGRKHQSQRIQRLLNVYAAIENKKKLKSIDLRYSNGLAVELLDNAKQNG